MVFLDAAAVIALAISCAPDVAPAQIAAIAKTESAFQTLAIHDNTARQSYQPPDKNSAITLAKNLLEAGHSLDVGIMQINTANFRWLALTLDDAFEPCPSIKAGASVLTAVSRYNTGDSRAGFANGYVKRVLAAAADIRGTAAAETALIPSAKAAPTVPHDWDVFPEEPQPEQGQVEQMNSPEDTPPSATSSDDHIFRDSQDSK
jgi:type IV secretion system protein VirB1